MENCISASQTKEAWKYHLITVDDDFSSPQNFPKWSKKFTYCRNSRNHRTYMEYFGNVDGAHAT